GITLMHYDMRFLKPIDESALKNASAKCSTIITVEDGSVIGGLYSAVSEYIASHKLNIKVIGMGVPDRFIEQGSVPELQHECCFDEESIYNMITDVSKETS
ncbi:MAG: transketolase C-terminal domain-containing protein, partial [Bacteroidales bacterium]